MSDRSNRQLVVGVVRPLGCRSDSDQSEEVENQTLQDDVIAKAWSSRRASKLPIIRLSALASRKNELIVTSWLVKKIDLLYGVVIILQTLKMRATHKSCWWQKGTFNSSLQQVYIRLFLGQTDVLKITIRKYRRMTSSLQDAARLLYKSVAGMSFLSL